MKAPSLTIASWNLQKCVGLDLRRNPQRVLEVLEDTGAQVAILQEADKRLPPRPAALPHGMAREAGWEVLPFGPLGPGGPSLGFHGNAMLVRPGVGVRSCHRIELPGLEPRGAIRAELDTAIGPLRVVGAHLGLIRRYRLMQLAAIRRGLDALPPCATLLAGDFNEWSRGEIMNHVIAPLSLLPPVPSFPAPRPVAPLDRFAIAGPVAALAPPRTHLAAPARIASDHLAVVVTLTAQAAAQAGAAAG